MVHGRHIKVLGIGAPDKLRSIEGVEQFLVDMIHALDMRCLGEPHTYEVEEEIEKLGVEPFEDEGGVTGVCVLSTSHCAIHTWPLRSFFVMDVYSCRDFDEKVVRELVSERFETQRLRITDLTFALEPDWEDDALAGGADADADVEAVIPA
jgi:S-adenosylmethionine decarboxylase